MNIKGLKAFYNETKFNAIVTYSAIHKIGVSSIFNLDTDDSNAKPHLIYLNSLSDGHADKEIQSVPQTENLISTVIRQSSFYRNYKN